MARSSDQVRTRFRYSLLKILSGSDLSPRRIPYMEARSERPGPTVWLTACAHGDEVGGIVVVQEVFKRLRRSPLLRGTLHAFPLMNPIGFEMGARHVTVSEEDLNRSFPGNPTGTLAERIAAKIFGAIVETEPEVVLDLHNDWTRSIPYTVLDPPVTGEKESRVGARVLKLAGATGFPLVVETDPVRKSLSHSLIEQGVCAMTVELGESYVVNEMNVEFGVRSVASVLSELGMMRPAAEPFRSPMPESAVGKLLRYSSRPYSSTSGIIRFLVRPGDVVRSGQCVAKVYSAFGRLQESLAAAADAIVLGYTDSSVAFPGAPVMAFGLLEPTLPATPPAAGRLADP